MMCCEGDLVAETHSGSHVSQHMLQDPIWCRLRDEVLPPLGVQLTDRAGTDQGSDWVLECPSVLRLEAEAKEREAAVQRSQKT